MASVDSYFLVFSLLVEKICKLPLRDGRLQGCDRSNKLLTNEGYASRSHVKNLELEYFWVVSLGYVKDTTTKML